MGNDHSKGPSRPSSEPIEGRNTYVGCLDVLGFKSLLARHEGKLAQAYRHLLNVYRVAGGVQLQVKVGDAKTGQYLRGMTLGFQKLRAPVVFSDSVFLLTEDDSQESLDEICLYANTLFRKAIESNLPLRGAISVGRTWHYPKERVTMGHGFVRAFSLEQSLDTLGVVLDSLVPPTSAAGEPMPVPTKNGIQQLRPVLGVMRNHPPHLPIATQLSGWKARIEALRRAAPPEAQAKYDHPLVEAMFAGGA